MRKTPPPRAETLPVRLALHAFRHTDRERNMSGACHLPASSVSHWSPRQYSLALRRGGGWQRAFSRPNLAIAVPVSPARCRRYRPLWRLGWTSRMSHRRKPLL